MIKNVLIGFFICFPLFAYNQNYLSDTASLDFARSLYEGGEYEECELALSPHISKSKNDSIYVLYLKLLCAQKRYTSALNLDLPSDFKLKNAELFKHTLSVYLDSFQYINNLVFLNSDLKAYLYLKEFDTSEVRFLLNNKHLEDSVFVTEQLFKMAEFKVYNNWPIYSAFLLPGSGKMLLGNNRDGLITMFSFGTYTFLAGRAYGRYGISSIFGWVNSALALGFYGANIVGTKNEINRQKKYRQQQINEIVNERIESFMFAIPH